MLLTWRPAKVALAPPPAGGGAQGARFATVVYDPAGADDGRNVNQERVVIKNTTGKAKNLGGWNLRDVAGAVYQLPTYYLTAGGSVTVHSGNGRNHGAHLYAGWGYTWNNTGDTATLKNKLGTTADRCSWGDGSGTTHC